jgi:SAM-dependent methyltransferase
VTTKRDSIDASYYQNLHDTNQAFLVNNWLMAELAQLRKSAKGTRSILELGCGNGRFLEAAASHWELVTGVDWAKSPYLENVLLAKNNVSFVQADISTLKLDQDYGLIVSADFLEHLPTHLLPGVIAESLRAGRFNFHKIACYDDGHSHLSILPPESWLALFHAHPAGRSMRITSEEARKGNRDNLVITISNLPS